MGAWCPIWRCAIRRHHYLSRKVRSACQSAALLCHSVSSLSLPAYRIMPRMSSCLDFSSQMDNGQEIGATLNLDSGQDIGATLNHLCSLLLLVIVSVRSVQSNLCRHTFLYTGPHQAVVVLWQSKKEGRLTDPPPTFRKGIVGQNLGGWASLTVRNCSLTYIAYFTVRDEVLRYSAFISTRGFSLWSMEVPGQGFSV